ncbi:MAG TPA: hypothetical protein VK211_14245 [Kamptonema sp.]|nr:hypothetical protein [Kamptonema sp.]
MLEPEGCRVVLDEVQTAQLLPKEEGRSKKEEGRSKNAIAVRISLIIDTPQSKETGILEDNFLTVLAVAIFIAYRLWVYLGEIA